MSNNDNHISCSFAGELVSYLYDEMTTSDRNKFDLHLTECSDCIEEFAGLSLARLGVYEWHRDEFKRLETPVINIPYVDAKPQTAKTYTDDISWLDTLRGVFSTVPRWATAGGAFAILAVGLGIALLASGFIGVFDNELAADTRGVPVLSNDNTAVSELSIIKAKPEVPTAKPLTPRDVIPFPAMGLEETARNPVAVKAAWKVRNSKPEKTIDRNIKTDVGSREKNVVSTSQRNAPRLNNFEDEEDNSLRLADLFADTDTRR